MTRRLAHARGGPLEAHEATYQPVVATVRRVGIGAGEQLIEAALRIRFRSRNAEAKLPEPWRADRDKQRCDAPSMLPQIVEPRLNQVATRKIGRCHRSTATGRFRFRLVSKEIILPQSAGASFGQQAPVLHRRSERTQVASLRKLPAAIRLGLGRGLALDHLFSCLSQHIRSGEAELPRQPFKLLVKRVRQSDFGSFHGAKVKDRKFNAVLQQVL